MRLRGALPTSVMALLLAAVCAMQASVRGAPEPGGGQGQPAPGAQSQAQAPSPSPSSSQTVNDASPAEGPLPPVGAISSYEGLPIADLRFPDVTSDRDRKQFLQQSGLAQGAPLQREQVRKSIQSLYATGRFADIEVEAQKTSDGMVALIYHTVPNYFIGQVTAEGVPSRPTEGQLVNASKLQLGELFDQEKLDRALRNMNQLMQENGYYRYTIKEEGKKHPDTQQIDIAFHVNSGPQAHIGSVTVTGSTTYSGLEIRDIAKMHSGDPVSAQRVTNALEHLRKKYQKQSHWLAQVTIASRTYHPESNAVDFVFEITSGPRVEITTDGFKISRSVLKRNVPVYQENALDDDLLNEGRRNLLNYLQSRGYFEAKLDYRKRNADDGKVLRVIYRIDSGPRHKLVKIAIAGNNYFSEELLRSHMQVQPAGRVLSTGRYSQRLLSDDIRGLEELYRANGFQDVKITSTVQDDYQGQANQLAVDLKIEEGPQTRVGALHISGNQTYTAEKLSSLINTSEGQPFSEFNVSQDRDSILNYYFNHGFPDASFEASAKPMPGEPNRMDVTFNIHEGRQVFVDQVLVSGLDHTHPFVVQRELQVKTGDPLSQIDMLTTQQKLYDLGIFSQVDTAVQNPQGDERSKNVLVSCRRGPPLHLQLRHWSGISDRPAHRRQQPAAGRNRGEPARLVWRDPAQLQGARPHPHLQEQRGPPATARPGEL